MAAIALATGMAILGYALSTDKTTSSEVIPSIISQVPEGQEPNSPDIYTARDSSNDTNVERQHLDLEKQAQNLTDTNFAPSIFTSEATHQAGEDYSMFAHSNYHHGLMTKKETQPTQKEAFAGKLRMFTGSDDYSQSRTAFKNINNLSLPEIMR